MLFARSTINQLALDQFLITFPNFNLGSDLGKRNKKLLIIFTKFFSNALCEDH